MVKSRGWFGVLKYNIFCLLSKIEKVPRGIRGEKSSKDMASSRNLVSTIGADIFVGLKCIYLNNRKFWRLFSFFRNSFFYDPLPINGIINIPKLCFKLQNSL